MITEEIRKFVESECRKSTSKYGFEPYETHFITMVKNSLMLAEKLNADKEVVEIAAWLHDIRNVAVFISEHPENPANKKEGFLDIGSVIYGRENHHITGARIAEEKLTELSYNREKIELVKKCILNHRGSVSGKRETIEEQIIADADGMAMLDRIEGVFMAAFVYVRNVVVFISEHPKNPSNKQEGFFDNKLSEDAKEIIKPKFEAAMLLLT